MSSRSGVALLLLMLAVAVGGCTRQSPAPEQANGTATPTVTAGAVDRSHRGASLPAAALTDLDGKAVTLAATGRPLLVNLWATWCAPCVAELPSLDRAATGLEAVAIDQGEDAKPVAGFVAGRRLGHLRPLLDRAMGISLALSANLPTTILYDGRGREVWRVTGGRDWATPDSRALLAETGG